MNRKIIVFLMVMLFSVSFVWAENNTTETPEIDDAVNYILANSIDNNAIVFSDGFTGFGIDSSKDDVKTGDEFLQVSFKDNNLENTIKLAIIECYKQGKENDVAKVISQIADKSYSSNDDVISAVLKSSEKIGSQKTVEISDDSEATFNFERLESADENTSDCIAYTVSVKEIPHEDRLAAAADDGNVSESEDTTNSTDESPADENDTADKDKTAENANKTSGDDKNKTDRTVVNETNTTIITKTNTTIINETNTTIINRHNINNTTEAPQNNTTADTLLKTVGNPISILIIALAVILIAVFAIRRKG